MFDIGLPELVVIMLIVLLVVGPEDIPRILYRLGRFVRYVSGHWNSVKGTIGDVMHEAELNEYRIKANEQKEEAEDELLADFEAERLSDEAVVLPPDKPTMAKKKSVKQKTAVKKKNVPKRKPTKTTTKPATKRIKKVSANAQSPKK